MVKFSRGKVIAFDIDEALSFEGESGPYLQYAVVRAQQHPAASCASATASTRPRWSPSLAVGAAGAPWSTTSDADELWALVLEAARLDEVVEQVVRTLEFSRAGQVRVRAGAGVQRLLPPLRRSSTKSRQDVRLWRAAASSTSGGSSPRALDLMGIDVPPGCRVRPHAARSRSHRAARWPTTSSRSAAPVASRASNSTLADAPDGRGAPGRRPAAHRRRRRRSGALRRARRTRPSTPAEPGRDAFEIALVTAAVGRRPAGAGHLPRPAGAERRASAARWCRTSPARSTARSTTRCSEPRFAIAHEVWRRARPRRCSTLMQDELEDGESCPVNSRHHQAVQARSATASRWRPRRPTA